MFFHLICSYNKLYKIIHSVLWHLHEDKDDNSGKNNPFNVPCMNWFPIVSMLLVIRLRNLKKKPFDFKNNSLY